MSKGRKPKKPISNATQALLASLQRRKGVKELEKRFLIVCEDTKSAIAYFKALKKHLKLTATSVIVAHSDNRTQPIQVVEEAFARKKEAASRRSGTEPFDHVWCVIDGDYGDKIPPARAKAKARRIELAISTMCFEYWVLLHFEKCDQSTINCDGVVDNLRSRHLPNYEKGNCDFRQIVKAVEIACKRAETLRKPGIERGELPEAQNPCSELYRLINLILETKNKNTAQVSTTATTIPQPDQTPSPQRSQATERARHHKKSR
ncbi:MAG: RloB family protein [Isosphaeraceae bacterium]